MKKLLLPLFLLLGCLNDTTNSTTSDEEPEKDLSITISDITSFKVSTESLKFQITLGADVEGSATLNQDVTISVIDGNDTCEIVLSSATLTPNPGGSYQLANITIPEASPCDTVMVQSNEVTVVFPADLFAFDNASSPEYTKENITLI